MEVAVGIAVVEFDRHCVVCVLVDGPYEADEVKTEVAPLAAPWRAAGLEGYVCFGRPDVEGTAFCDSGVAGGEVCVSAFAVDVGLDVARTVIVDYKVVAVVIFIVQSLFARVLFVHATAEDIVESWRAFALVGGTSAALDDRGGDILKGCSAGRELEEPGLVLRYNRGEGVELALVGGEGECVFTRMPGEGHDILVVVLCDDRLRLGIPNDELAVGASTGEKSAIGRPRKVGDVAVVPAGKHATGGPVRAVDEDEIACSSRCEERPPVRVPGNLRTHLRLPRQRPDNTVDLLDKGGLLAAQRVNVYGAVGPGHGQVVTERMKRDVFC